MKPRISNRKIKLLVYWANFVNTVHKRSVWIVYKLIHLKLINKIIKKWCRNVITEREVVAWIALHIRRKKKQLNKQQRYFANMVLMESALIVLKKVKLRQNIYLLINIFRIWNSNVVASIQRLGDVIIVFLQQWYYWL